LRHQDRRPAHRPTHTGEQALEIAGNGCAAGAGDIVAIDSVAALVPRAELDGDMGTRRRLQAVLSQALRSSPRHRRSKTAVVFTPAREKVGVMFGNPETTPGGRALKFYASVRLDIRRVEAIKQGTEIVGNRTRLKVVKNKVAPPFRQAEFDIMYNEGISREGDLLDVGLEMGFVQKSGAFYSHGDTRIGQGRENAKSFLRENPESPWSWSRRRGKADALRAAAEVSRHDNGVPAPSPKPSSSSCVRAGDRPPRHAPGAPYSLPSRSEAEVLATSSVGVSTRRP